MKFSIEDFFGRCDQIRSFLWIWSHLLKKYSMENLIFCAVKVLGCESEGFRFKPNVQFQPGLETRSLCEVPSDLRIIWNIKFTMPDLNYNPINFLNFLQYLILIGGKLFYQSASAYKCSLWLQYFTSVLQQILQNTGTVAKKETLAKNGFSSMEIYLSLNNK